MNKRTFIFWLACASFVTSSLFSQAPAGFNYQAVYRNTSGSIIANTDVELSLSILQGSVAGPSVFDEMHSVTTSDLGLINIVVGSSDPGALTEIDWSNGPYFLRIKVDGIEFGTSQLLSVPYALYAASGVGTQGPQGIEGPQGIQGEQGPSGPQGEQGLQGLKGDKGDQGIQGVQGIQGPKGDKGDQGIQGPAGPEGPSGPAGPAGSATTNASLLTSGTLSTDRYNAYLDLLYSGSFDDTSPLGILVRSQSDERYNKQVSFFAYNAETYDYGESVHAADPYVGVKAYFSTEKYDLSNNYNTTNSRFTAPVNGIYLFSAQVFVSTRDDWSEASLRCYVNGSYYAIFGYNEYKFYGFINGSIILRLNAGQYVEIYFDTNNYSGSYPKINGLHKREGVATFFSGSLLHPIY